jgi:ribosomal 50S subunit-recycling heat shock protein
MAVTQSHYRFGIDELAESTHGWYAAEDTNPQFGAIPLDTTFLLRFCLQADGTAANNQAPQFQYRLNGGTWTNITTSSNVARAVATAVFAEGDNTSKRLSGTGTFEASSAGCTEDGLAGGTAMDIVSNGNAETECSIQLRSADLAPGDLVEFRVINTATPFTTYAVTPALGVPLQAVFSGEATRARDLFIAAAIGVASSMLSAGILEHPVKISDTVSAQLVLPVTGSEHFRVTDTVTAQIPVGNLSQSLSEDIKVSDAVAASLNLNGSVSESAKADDGGRVDLYGLGNPIKITDGPVIASLVTPGADVSLSEAVKVVDLAPSVTLNPEQASPSESLKIVDGPPTATLVSGGIVTALSETFKTDDGGRVDLFGLGNPIRITDGPVIAALTTDSNLGTSLLETIKVADSGEVEISRDETIRISESLFASIGLGDVSLVETVKVADAPAVTLNPEQASLSESLKVADALSLTINPEQASPSEALKVVDAPSITLNPEQAAPSEALKASDALTTALTPEETTASEALKVVDSPSVLLNPEQATPSESLKVVDVVSAARIDAGALAATLGEDVKVSDAPLLTLNPEQASLSESLKISDEISATRLEAGALTVAASESLKVADTSAQTLNPEQASLSESLKVVDSLAASIQGPNNLAVQVADDALKVVDALTTVRQLGIQVADEGLSVVDGSPSARLNPLQVGLSEDLSVVDLIATGTVLPALVPTEPVKVADVLTVAIDPEQREVGEALKVADAIALTLDPEQANPSETLAVQDTVQASFDVLLVNLAESIRIEDIQPRFGGPSTITIVGSYVTTIDIIGSYVTTIDIVGEVS